jgi:hypothetical protein
MERKDEAPEEVVDHNWDKTQVSPYLRHKDHIIYRDSVPVLQRPRES